MVPLVQGQQGKGSTSAPKKGRRPSLPEKQSTAEESDTSADGDFVPLSHDNAVPGVAPFPHFSILYPGLPTGNAVAIAVPSPTFPRHVQQPSVVELVAYPIYGVAPFYVEAASEDALSVSPGVMFASQISTAGFTSPTNLIAELIVESNADEEERTLGDSFGDSFHEATPVNNLDVTATVVLPRFATHVSEFPTSDMDPLPESSVMNYYVQEAFKDFFPYAIQIFAPDWLADLRRRAPLLLWGILLSGAARQDDVIVARPFLQRISRVWNAAKKSDGKSLRLPAILMDNLVWPAFRQL